MTTRLLPDIDLARIAPQRDDMKRKSLEQMKGGFSSITYNPVRACFPDIFNIQPDLDLGATLPTPWAVIEAELRKRSRSDEESPTTGVLPWVCTTLRLLAGSMGDGRSSSRCRWAWVRRSPFGSP